MQTRLADFSDCRTPADIELTSIGALKTILSELLLLRREHSEVRNEVHVALELLRGGSNEPGNACVEKIQSKTGRVKDANCTLSPLAFSVPSAPTEVDSSQTRRCDDQIQQAAVQQICANHLQPQADLHDEERDEKRAVEGNHQALDAMGQESQIQEPAILKEEIVQSARQDATDSCDATPQLSAEEPMKVPQQSQQPEQQTSRSQPAITVTWHTPPSEHAWIERLGDFSTGQPVQDSEGPAEVQPAAESVHQAPLSMDHCKPVEIGLTSTATAGVAHQQWLPSPQYTELDEAATPDPDPGRAPAHAFNDSDSRPACLDFGGTHVDIDNVAGNSMADADLFSLSTPSSSRSQSPQERKPPQDWHLT
jgi:hypothetical protein